MATKKVTELHNLLSSASVQDLMATIEKKCNDGDVGNYIRAVFESTSENNEQGEKRRVDLFKSSINLLRKADISRLVSSEIVSCLVLKVDSFHTSNLVALAEFFIDYAQTSKNAGNKWLEVFSKVLACLSNRDSIVYKGEDMSGEELRKTILISLFEKNEELPCAVELISVLKDTNLPQDELKMIVENVLKSLKSVDLIELPSYIYQLLLISSKGRCQQILLGVMSYFIQEDNKYLGNGEENCDSEDIIESGNETQFRQVEGTVILMISVSAKHDQKIIKEFCSVLKRISHKPDIVLSPFLFATAMSLSSSQMDIFDFLKKSLSVAFQLKGDKNDSLWLREMIPSNPDMLKLVKEAIKCSKFGWDHICQGLVKFGFFIMNTFGPRYIAGNILVWGSREGYMLGNHILRDTFKNHRIVRSEILEQILNLIITKSQKPVKHYIDILSQLVHSDPLFLLDVLPKIVELLDYIHLLPHQNAVDILQALAPLLRISMPLKDTLMLVLRKALFHRDIEARKVAVSGYLMILKKLNFLGKVSLSQSQTSISSQASSASVISTQVRADVYVSAGNPSSRTMCLEIMGLLKRVLMQQCAVRQMLYEGLYDVALQNKALRDIILELLLGQFEKYYVPDESADVPLNFDLCFQEQKGEIVEEEPLGHLITAIHLILFEIGDMSDDEDYDQSAQKMLEDYFLKLTKRMAELDIVDLQVTSKDSEEKSIGADKTSLVMKVYESLLEYSLMLDKEYNKDSCNDLLLLYRKYKELSDSLLSKKQKKPVKGRSVHVSAPMHVSLRYFSQLIQGLFVDSSLKHREGLELLRKNTTFVVHMVAACNLKLTKLGDQSNDGFSTKMANNFDSILNICKTYFKTYGEGVSSYFTSGEQEKLTLFLSEGLASIFKYILNLNKEETSKFIIGICNQNVSTTQALQFSLKSTQKYIMKLLSDTENDVNLKEVIPFLTIIKTLCVLFVEDSHESVFKWVKQLCLQQTFQGDSIVSSFMSLCATLCRQQPQFMTFLREIAFDVHFHMGDVDSEERVNGTAKYNVITSESAKAIVPIINEHIMNVLNEVEPVLQMMVANLSLPVEFQPLSGNTDSSRESAEQGLCSRMSDTVLVLHELVQTCVPVSAVSNVLKILIKFYKNIALLTKYYQLLFKAKVLQLSGVYEKLVKLLHTKLTSFVYAFITYIQTRCEEESSGKKKSKNSSATASAMREIKTIPALVFEIESFEKNLILLSKSYKTNLMNHMKISTARDFRINASALQKLVEESNADNDSTVDDGDVDNNEQNNAKYNEADGVVEEAQDESSQSSVSSNDGNTSSAKSVKKITSGPSTRNKSTLNKSSKLSRKKISADQSTSSRGQKPSGSKLNNVKSKENGSAIDKSLAERRDSSSSETAGVKRKRLGVRGNLNKKNKTIEYCS